MYPEQCVGVNRKIILIGGGGHCRSCIDVIQQEGRFSIAGIVDTEEKLSRLVSGYEIIATDNDLPHLVSKYQYFMITIGQIKRPEKRIGLFEKIRNLGGDFPTIVSPHAYVSANARVGDGSIVMHHAIINTGASVGANCIINTGALIEHGTRVGDHCHIATRAVLNGDVRIGNGSFVGSNAVVRENIEVGENVLIGCGSKVIRNISKGQCLG